MSAPEERAARNEALFREVNQHIQELAERIRRSDTMAIVCECSHRDCLTTIEVEPAAYHAVRANPLRFLISPGHEQTDVEQVVERTPAYLVVEKTGHAAGVVMGASPVEAPSGVEPLYRVLQTRA